MKKAKLIVSLVLIISTVICPAYARDTGGDQVQPNASKYIIGYGADVKILGRGMISVSFSIQSEFQMQNIGAVSVIIMESSDNSTFTTVASFRAESVSSLMGHNRLSYSSSITYQGDPGKYYKATVTLRVTTSSGETETRYVWTGSKQAT